MALARSRWLKTTVEVAAMVIVGVANGPFDVALHSPAAAHRQRLVWTRIRDPCH